ncbi:RNA polymerase subunit RPABC4/transcription elongation factor Spt4 [Streptomyces netropsis]|uniref:RNA polymerase subunit RPABC4/transcription elongation factor Spt4 n=1 Tax=Streptomyces netropsis TaxID=55404 RepID=A0A7W7PG86_STRNE|nr:RNA polymerase subunit RPABC4/transcription elongation factor Spt4 [Streptomyces netropsis]
MDWKCQHCTTQNPPDAENCRSCGQPWASRPTPLVEPRD